MSFVFPFNNNDWSLQEHQLAKQLTKYKWKVSALQYLFLTEARAFSVLSYK